MIQGFVREVSGFFSSVPSVIYAKESKGVLDVRCSGRYHAPIFLCYKEGRPCKLEDLVGLPVKIKWGQDIDHKGITRTYIFVHHWPNIEATDELRMLLVSEKSVGAGAWIKYDPCEPIIDERFFSGGGTHWQRFLLTKEKVVAGTRVTATRNNHNTYAIEA